MPTGSYTINAVMRGLTNLTYGHLPKNFKENL
jgi:hypothetical protein